MSEVTAQQVMDLRKQTNLPVNDCRAALIETDGDAVAATRILRERGNKLEESRAGRATKVGKVFSYVHQGRIGVLVVLCCETDFVAKTDLFEELGRELCLQVAAMNPKWVSRDAVPAEIVEEEMSIVREQTLREGKPACVVDKIVEGRMNKFYYETCLYEQNYIRDPKTIPAQMIADVIGKTGEKIVVERFVREEV